MITKPAVYKYCSKCGSGKKIADEEICCDTCKAPLKGLKYLVSTVYRALGGEVERFLFCSWKCFFKKMRKVSCDYFISLPFLHYDETSKKSQASGEEFWKYIKKRR